jgi:V8-like Glu-specific endopeptidase
VRLDRRAFTISVAVSVALAGVAEAVPSTQDRSFGDHPVADIVGSTPVDPGQLRAVAYVETNVASWRCTGTLVAPRVVLTAGHCIGDGQKALRVVLDTTDFAVSGESIPVVQQVAYPGWQTSYDVAVLLLERDALTPPQRVGPPCATAGRIAAGASISAAGFGATNREGTSFGTRLNQATLFTGIATTSMRRS